MNQHFTMMAVDVAKIYYEEGLTLLFVVSNTFAQTNVFDSFNTFLKTMYLNRVKNYSK